VGRCLPSPALPSRGQPLQLTDRQLDGVTAGATAIADGLSWSIGDVTADTVTQTLTNVSSANPKFAIGQAQSAALAGGFYFPAVASSHTDAYASIP
jgi:hypothetical protein